MSEKVLVECKNGHALEIDADKVLYSCPICEIYRNKSMKIYIAAGFNSMIQATLLEKELKKLGHTIISSWFKKQEATEKENALQDLNEVEQADCIIFLTYTRSTKGGRYVEQGYALALKRSGKEKRLIICGPKENCFCHLEEFEYYYDVRGTINAL